MSDERPYDRQLTADLHAEITAWGEPSEAETQELRQLLGRLEGEFRSILEDSAHPDRIVGFLRGIPPGTGGLRAASKGPVRDTLVELVSLSSQLDQTVEPAEGFASAERVGHRAHELVHTIERLIPALRPSDGITGLIHDLSAFLARLIGNVVARIREFAKRIGATAFSIDFSFPPPSFSVGLIFG